MLELPRSSDILEHAMLEPRWGSSAPCWSSHGHAMLELPGSSHSALTCYVKALLELGMLEPPGSSNMGALI
eukprot:964105-Pyramimonas_sp.AAC.1